MKSLLYVLWLVFIQLISGPQSKNCYVISALNLFIQQPLISLDEGILRLHSRAMYAVVFITCKKKNNELGF